MGARGRRPAACRPASAPPAWRRASSPAAGPTSACSSSDAPETTSAARFTRSGVLAAPVLVTRERSRLDALRVVVANSGNANAATGGRGMDDAAKMQGAAAMAGGVEADRVAVASTGVIGVPLDSRAVVSGLARARAELRPDGDADFAAAIMTTDAFEKRASLEVELTGGTVRLCAQAKGAGMISPAFATMLCFVQTDAALSAETADLLLGVCVKRSFERISVDGQLSTNDTAILMCLGRQRGRRGARVRGRAALRPGARRAPAPARAARSCATARAPSASAASSCAAGTATASRAPRARWPTRRWSRPRCTAATPTGGASCRPSGWRCPAPRRWRSTSGSRACRCARGGGAIAFDATALAQAVARDEVEYVVELPGEGHETEVFFSDLSHEYVTINAEYTT